MYWEQAASIHTALHSSLASYDQSAECNQAPPPALATVAALAVASVPPSSRTAQCPQRHSEQEVDPQGLEKRSHVWTEAEVSKNVEGAGRGRLVVNK